MSDDRLDRLEQRIAVLERLVRQLAASSTGFSPAPGADRPGVTRPAGETGVTTARSAARVVDAPVADTRVAGSLPHPESGEEAPAAQPPLGVGIPQAPPSDSPSPPAPPSIPAPEPTITRPAGHGTSSLTGAPSPTPAATPLPPRRAPSGLDSERWIGQRVFLGIGVIALLLAAGYLLKLSFERGWISPVMRCLGGIAAGLGVGALGWRLEPRYRTYGAALVGAGAGIIYLCIWAAVRLYGVLPSASGTVGLALVSVALAMIAYAIDVEALGVTAALGAFFAPILLGQDRAAADLLLLYLFCMAVGLGMVAARRRWRVATLVVAAAYFGVGTMGAGDHARPWAVLLYGLIGGTAGLYLGLREHWWETRLLTFSGGWTTLAAASERIPQHWAVLAAGLVLSLPIFQHALRRPQLFPVHLGPRGAGPGWSAGEAFYFFATPVLLAWAVGGLDPGYFRDRPWLAPLLVGLPYVLAGYAQPRPAFASVGAAALGVAAVQRWEGVPQVWALLMLAVLWAALDLALGRTDGRWYGLITLMAGLQQLFDGAAGSRTADDRALVGPWARALWGGIAVTTAFALRLWRVEPGREDVRLIRAGLWVVAGAMALFGVTGELHRYFELQTLNPETAALASGLAVSAWWLLFAAALVGAGFRLALQPARVAGLVVAGLAVLKVVLFDLSSLDALYRVGSVFLLALVALSLAYLYYRYDRSERA